MLLPFDELNEIEPLITKLIKSDDPQVTKKKVADDCIDIILDALIVAYVYGVENVNEALGVSIEPVRAEMRESIYRKVAGKDFSERVREYAEKGDIPAIMRVADTDMTRVFNEGGLTAAYKGGARTKTWNTMMDERVREGHSYIEGVTVPIDADFYTYNGDHAPAPGGFESPELNVNCRCYLTFS